MHTLGLLGGMSWESTATYYKLINEGVQQRLGGLHSAPLVLWSVDFAGVEELQRAGAWNEAGRRLGDLGDRLRLAGAERIILATNTMHAVAGVVAERSGLQLIHIGSSIAKALRSNGVRCPLLLGTRYTMEMAFLPDAIRNDGFVDSVVTPDPDDRSWINDVIFDDLCVGTIDPVKRNKMLRLIERYEEGSGTDGVILGCTELNLLVGPDDVSGPVIDSTTAHAQDSVDFVVSADSKG